MPTYYATFGMKYRREDHPRADWAHPDGWLEVAGFSNYEAAREAVVALLGTGWSMLYAFSEFNPRTEIEHYPLGPLATLRPGALVAYGRVYRRFERFA